MATVDRNGKTLEAGNGVWVKVGSGSTLRPGIIDRITEKGVFVTFRWANRRETSGRKFGIAHRKFVEGVPVACDPFVYDVYAVDDTERSSWVMSWTAAAPKTDVAS